MTALQRRIFRWLSYVFYAVGFLGIALGLLAIGMMLFGAADQRANGFGLAVLGFGGGFADVLLGVAFRSISRSAWQGS